MMIRCMILRYLPRYQTSMAQLLRLSQPSQAQQLITSSLVQLSLLLSVLVHLPL